MHVQQQAHTTTEDIRAALAELREGHRERTPAQYTHIIGILGVQRDWQTALACLEQMKADGVEPDVVVFYKTWQACSKSGELDHALQLLEQLRSARLSPSKNLFSKMILFTLVGSTGKRRPTPASTTAGSTLTRATDAGTGTESSSDADELHADASSAPGRSAEQQRRAIDVTWGLVRDLLEDGQRPNGKAALFVAMAMLQARRTRDAVTLLGEMRAANVRPEKRLYTMVLHACLRQGDQLPSRGRTARNEWWNSAFELLECMWRCGIGPTLETVLSLGHVARRADHAHVLPRLYDDIVARGGNAARSGKGDESDNGVASPLAASIASSAGHPSSDTAEAPPADDGTGVRTFGKAGRVPTETTFKSALHLLHEHEQFGHVLALHAAMVEGRRVAKPDHIAYAMALNSCEKLGLVVCALLPMPSPYRHTSASTVTRPSVLALLLFVVAAQDDALAIFQEMVHGGGISPDKFHFCPVIAACGRAGRPQQALDIFASMQTKYGLPTTRITYTAAIQACADAGWWRKALDLYMRFETEAQSRPATFEPDASSDIESVRITFNAILDAVAPFTSSRSAYALPPPPDVAAAAAPAAASLATAPTATPGGALGEELSSRSEQVAQLPQHATPPTTGALDSALDCTSSQSTGTGSDRDDMHDDEQRRVVAEMLWARALEVDAYGPLESKRCRRTAVAQRFDLHNMSVGAGEMAVRWWLRRIGPQLLAAHESNVPMPTLCIVTGRGKTRPEYQRKDMRESIEELLVTLGVPTITALHDARRFDEQSIALRHEGALFIDAEAIAWMARIGGVHAEPPEGARF